MWMSRPLRATALPTRSDLFRLGQTLSVNRWLVHSREQTVRYHIAVFDSRFYSTWTNRITKFQIRGSKVSALKSHAHHITILRPSDNLVGGLSVSQIQTCANGQIILR